MIARVKYDLRELYKYINIGSHNKYWRKVLGSNNRYLPREHKDALFGALKQYKICDDTINELKDVKMDFNVFFVISTSSLYTKLEKEEILEKYREYVDWYIVYDKSNVSMDFKINHYEEIVDCFIKKHRGTKLLAKDKFKDIEREYKIRQLLEEV